MARYEREVIPRLGMFETFTAKHYVLTGEWHPDYRAALEKLGRPRPPAHLIEEIKVMKRRYEAGDPDWRDGTRKPRRKAHE